MKVFYDLESFPDEFRGGAVSIGKFDGIHLGHVLILHRLRNHANRIGGRSIVLTFDPPPTAILRPELHARPICTLRRKIELIGAFGIDAVLVFRTTPELLRMSAETFFYEIFRDRLAAKVVVEGVNFNFGRDRIGNSESIRLYGQWTGIEVDIVESVRLGEDTISSSGIRRLLHDGRIDRVNELMPRPYQLSGTVVEGRRRGRTLGFPTANLADVETIIPRSGIYATVARLDGRSFASTTHIGNNPTFREDDPKIEVFLHDFQGDLYGRTLDIDFLAHLRDIVRFDSPEDLVRQMNRDVCLSGEISRNHGVAGMS